MTWLSVVLAGGCLVVALLHGMRAVVAPGRRVPAELLHLVMALGMAAMFAPADDPVPRGMWVVTFGVCTAWAAVAVVRRREIGGELGHHLVGSAAMLFMLLVGHGAAGWGAPAAIVLAGACGWHALRCVERLHEQGPVPGGGVAVAARTSRLADLGHVGVAVAMTVMLLGAV